jgi:hypothetical protein
MAWVQIQKTTQATWSDYESVQEALGDERPEGLLYHAAGEIEGGRWQSVSVWESEEHYNHWRDEKLMPAVEKALPPALAQGGPPASETFIAKHVVGVE